MGAASAALIDGAQVPVTLELTAQQTQSIVALDDAGCERHCTGTLISSAWVLSAAHCAAAAPIGSTIDVSAGDGCTTTLRAVDAVQRHSSLDLLLLHLDEPVPDSVASPLEVNVDASVVDDRLGGSVELTGFGLTEHDTFARRFVAADVVKLSVTTVTVDALDDSGACLGDSGGALLQECAPSRPCVLGVVSRG